MLINQSYNFTALPDRPWREALEKAHGALSGTSKPQKQYRCPASGNGLRCASPGPGWLPSGPSQNEWDR